MQMSNYYSLHVIKKWNFLSMTYASNYSYTISDTTNAI